MEPTPDPQPAKRRNVTPSQHDLIGLSPLNMTDRKFDSARGGRLATHVGPPLRLFPPVVRRFWPISRSHPGTPGVRGPSTGNMSAVYPVMPPVARLKSACSARVHGSRGSSGWSIASRRILRVQERQGRVVCQWLVEFLATEMFQGVGIDLVGDSRAPSGA